MHDDNCRIILGWKLSNPAWTGDYDYFHPAATYEGELTPAQLLSPLGLAPIVSAEEAVDLAFRSPILLERLCEAQWLCPLDGHDDPYFNAQGVYQAMLRLLGGEQPPRTSYEPPRNAGDREIGNAGSLQGYVNAAKAAEFLSLAPSTLREYSDRGLIPCVRIGKHRRYDLEKIKEELEEDARKTRPVRVQDLKDLLR